MEKTFKEKIDIVDALEDGKVKLAFLAYAYSSMHEDPELIPSRKIVHGLYLMLSEMAEQMGAISEGVQHNLFEVEKTGCKKVAGAR